MTKKSTLVLGASPNPERYAYRAVELLQSLGYPVWALGIRKGNIGSIEISPQPQLNQAVDTVSVYLSPDLQEAYLDYLIALKPKRLIFNPGTENPSFAQKLQTKLGPDFSIEQACTLVLLHTGQY